MTAASAPAQAPASRTSFRELVAGEVRAQLGRQRLSNRQFAKLLGTTPTWVDRHLNGKTPINADHLEQFTTVLGVSMEDLLREAIRKASIQGPPESITHV